MSSPDFIGRAASLRMADAAKQSEKPMALLVTWWAVDVAYLTSYGKSHKKHNHIYIFFYIV